MILVINIVIMNSAKELTGLSKYSIIPAILYCIPVVFFLEDHTYKATWLMYLGNALFLAGIFTISVLMNRKNSTDFNAVNKWMIAIMAIILSGVLIAILSFVLVPGIYGIGTSNGLFKNTPAAFSEKGLHGLLFVLFSNALLGNAFAGTLATLLAKSSSQKDQTPS